MPDTQPTALDIDSKPVIVFTTVVDPVLLRTNLDTPFRAEG